MKNKEKVIIIGSGGHAKIILDIIELENKYEIFGVVTNDKIENFYGYKVLGNDQILHEVKESGIWNVAIGIGGFTDNLLRERIFNKMIYLGFNVVNAIHPSAIISKTAELGKGVVLFAGVIINSEVKIFDNCIVATGSSIDHETTIENHCLISAGVTIGANVLIRKNVLCALGVKVISQIEIGEEILIGAGAVVVKSIYEKGCYLGVPARKII
tara:strand:- start:920 stop:1558 length:639 start_codon:yes stop_codon:yes gene_type:complete